MIEILHLALTLVKPQSGERDFSEDKSSEGASAVRFKCD